MMFGGSPGPQCQIHQQMEEIFMSTDKQPVYEIERKFLVKKPPENLNEYPCSCIEQGYLCTAPVVRVRKKDDNYILTYKSGGMMLREEYEHPLTAESYSHLIKKADGLVISKTRYRIPDKNGLLIELDIFHGSLEGFIMAEVEFESEEQALSYSIPGWFGKDVTNDPAFHNSRISRMNEAELKKFMLYQSALQ